MAQRDPVCGMDVDERKAAATATHQGKTYYFCAVACREVFTKAPERYLAAEQAARKGLA